MFQPNLNTPKQSLKNVQSFLGTKCLLRTFLTNIFTKYGNMNIKLFNFLKNLSNILSLLLILFFGSPSFSDFAPKNVVNNVIYWRKISLVKTLQVETPKTHTICHFIALFYKVRFARSSAGI